MLRGLRKAGSVVLPVLHFNDVYKMARPRVIDKGGRTPRIIDAHGLTNDSFDHVVAFSEKIKQIQNTWTKNAEKEPQGLLLFSGDLFSPSVESLLTHGSNMVHLINELAPDACVPGNHEFDFGRQRFDQLVEFCNFRWTLSNIKERTRDPVKKEIDLTKPVELLKRLYEYDVIDRAGLRIGIVGLMSEDALKKTNPAVRSTFEISDMKEVCMQLASRLRKPKEEKGEGCDLVFALTHAIHEEDIDLANYTGAYTTDSQVLAAKGKRLEDIPGIDAIFGGHIHTYYLGQGVKLVGESGPTEEYRPRYPKDDSLLIVKSGTDFDDLSEIEIEIEDRPNGVERKKVITSLTVTRHQMSVQEPGLVQPDSSMARLLRRQFHNEVLSKLDEAIATTDESFFVDKNTVRTGETTVGNWIADAMIGWYNHFRVDEEKTSTAPAQVFIMTAGSIRGGITLGPGKVKAKDIIQLVPFDTPLTALDVKGEDLKAALEGALSDSRRGSDGKLQSSSRFPVFSGMRVEWDSRKEQNRVGKIWLVDDEDNESEIDLKETYRVLTNTFLAEGGDGFDSFKGAQSHPTYGELPMHQVLRYYINDLITVDAYGRLLAMIFEYAVSGERTPETDALIKKVEALEPLLKDEDDEWGNASIIAKHVAKLLLGSDEYLPKLDIKTEIDHRLVDRGQPT